MLIDDLIRRNPLWVLSNQSLDILPRGGFGAVIARPGVGKTAILVQIALHGLLRGKRVLHISVGESVGKIHTWYEELFRNIVVEDDYCLMNRLHETILPNRYIMTLKNEDFDVERLSKRLKDIEESAAFLPQIVLIDGFTFDRSSKNLLTEMKSLAFYRDYQIWFSVLDPRTEICQQQILPEQIFHVKDLFEIIISIHPVKNEIYLKLLKDDYDRKEDIEWRLDPSTMLIKG